MLIVIIHAYPSGIASVRAGVRRSRAAVVNTKQRLVIFPLPLLVLFPDCALRANMRSATNICLSTTTLRIFIVRYSGDTATWCCPAVTRGKEKRGRGFRPIRSSGACFGVVLYTTATAMPSPLAVNICGVTSKKKIDRQIQVNTQ